MQSRVMRSNLNGTSMTVITSQILTPNGLHLDISQGILFVLDGVNGSLFNCQQQTIHNGINCMLFFMTFYDIVQKKN